MTTSEAPDPQELDPGHQPLLAHFIELRRRIIYSLVAVLVGFIISYYFAADIYTFLVRPLAEATKDEQRRLIYTGLT
ncbi:twin-arginine translocase subunit TatC, partial [Streptomyces scabiei]|uniref:twin-arginine translocase subunit TatC n=1 Tax=Streptomyces scabiei TaxID=1930 RepID=UPI0038F662FF